jgi:TRAP-type transport system periplasmic protein
MIQRRHLIGSAALASLGLPATALARDFNLTLAAGHAPVILWVKYLRDEFVPVANRELATTGNKINWNQAYSGTVARIGGELDAIQKGIVDIAIVGASFHQAKLNLLNLAYYAPFSSMSVKNTVETVDELHATMPELNRLWESFGATYLAGIGTDSFNLYSKVPLAHLSELRGMKIGGVGPNLNWLRGSGATGVVVTPNTIYNDLQTGIYDGLLIGTSQAASIKIHEVAPYCLKIDFQSTYWAGLVANKTFFAGLPKDVQSALRKAALSYRNVLLAEQVRQSVEGMETMRRTGLRVTDLSRTERLAWAASLPDLAGEWVKSVEEKGQPGRRMLQGYMDGVRAKGEVPARNWDRS